MKAAAPIDKVDVAAYRIPTDAPESDGTFTWDSTTLVVCCVRGGGAAGVGYTYADAAAASVVHRMLAATVCGRDAMDVGGCYVAMAQAVRNAGRDGIAACAIAAVDIALWDLKARLLDVALVTLLGAARERVPVYGSGGFTSYSIGRLQQQLGGWVADGIPFVKMKVGRDAVADRERVRAARGAIGADAVLMVDANGAYDRKQALDQADAFADQDVRWFEEPVTADDLEGLRLLGDRAPAAMEIAAGEYGFDTQYFRRMLEARAVDVLQADATRCAGITGFLRAGALCDAWCMPMSAHTSPSVHAHPCCAVARVRNLEYFHDHVRIERMLFDGVLVPKAGALEPDRSRPGLGISFKRQEAEKFLIT